MAIPLVPPWIIPPDAVESANDAAVKDQRVPARTLAQNAGWRGSAVKDAVGVMGAESSFNPAARNGTPCSKDGDHAIGLMQMCTIHAGRFGIPADKKKAEEWLKDPVNNLSAAYKLWVAAGGTFKKDWVQAQNGAYLKFRNQNPLIVTSKNSVTGAVTDAAGAVVDTALGPFDELAGALLNPSTWFRIGKGTLGWFLIVTGSVVVAVVIINKAAGSDTGKLAQTAVTKGKKIVK